MPDISSLTLEDASNPAIDPALMQLIARERPDLRASLALNPSLYPDLAAWLASLGDPAVDRALRLRGIRDGGPAHPIGAVPYGHDVDRPGKQSRRSSHRPRRRRSAVVLASFAVAFLLVVGGGGAYAAWRVIGTGSSSAQGAADTVIDAVLDKDLSRIARQIAPSERSELARVGAAFASSDNIQDGKLSGAVIDDAQRLLDGISLTGEVNARLVHQEPELAVFELHSRDLVVRYSPDAMSDGLLDLYDRSAFPEFDQQDRNYFRDDVRDFSGEIWVDLTEASYGSEEWGYGTIATSTSYPSPVRLIVVKESGRWYASVYMTVMEMLVWYPDYESGPDYGADWDSAASGAATPTAAVDATVNAFLPDQGAERWEPWNDTVISHLSLPERRVAMVYLRPARDEEAPSADYSSYSVKWSLTTTSASTRSRAVVAPSTVDLQYTDGGRDMQLTARDGCVRRTDSDLGEICLSDQVTAPENVGVVAVKEGDEWFVSVVGTYSTVLSLTPTAEVQRRGVDYEGDDLATSRLWALDFASEEMLGVRLPLP